TVRGVIRGARCPAYGAWRYTRGKMPRLRCVAVYTGQDAPPTVRGGIRGARCPAYGAWRYTRGKMPRLRCVAVYAGQDAPPTVRGGVLYENFIYDSSLR
ncbi:MAG: hypothetical protein OXP71_06085, partial [Candidatus Poribacteria bacterium]|nr:hypothetical protein [Candidatus Poribacteria bacterium]